MKTEPTALSMRARALTAIISIFAPAVVLWAFAAPPQARAQDAAALSQRLERLERDIQTLSKMVVRGPDAVAKSDIPAAAQQSSDPLPANAVARIGVRLAESRNPDQL